jgi:hypothetical protein
MGGAMLALILRPYIELPLWLAVLTFLAFLLTGMFLGCRVGAFLSHMPPGD